MGIRTSIVLKLIAIVLFSFEMIAPALISNTCSQSHETRISSSDHLTNVNTIAYLLCEESSGEEEQIAFEFIEAPSLVFTSDFRKVLRIEPHEITSSRPPLFTLFHTYII